MIGADGVEADEAAEVRHGELLVFIMAVAPDVPHEQRPDDFAVLAEERFVVEHGAVVERGRHH